MDIFYFLIFPGFFFAALVGLVFTWVDRKVTARLQWRVGPPFLQPFYDFGKLMIKEITIPERGEKFSFLLAPFLGLLATALVATILGLAVIVPTSGFVGDLIVVLYLLIIPALAVIIGGFASANPLASIGASREMKLVMGYELPFILAILVPVIKSDFSVKINQILFFQQQNGANIWSLSGFIAFLVCLLAVQAKLSFAPFDIAEAETELMGGPLLEYSGPKLALFKYAQMSKLVVYSGLFVALFVPWGSGLAFPWGWLLFWGKVSVLVVLVTLVAATHARYRIDQAIRYFATLLAVALGALLLASYGL